MVKKGRLYFLQNGSTENSVYFDIKQKQFLFGSSKCCTVRIYIDGIFPKHCVLTIGNQQKAYLEPLHPSALTYVNGLKIKHKVLLENNDVITIFGKEFQFTYSPNNLSSNVSIEKLLALPYAKKVELVQKFDTTLRDDWKSFCRTRDFRAPLKIYIPKKLICMIKSDISKKNHEHLLKFAQQKPMDISYKRINVQKSNSCSEKSLSRYMNWYVEESSEPRRNLSVKLCELFCFIRDSINRNGECRFDLLQIFESVWKCGFYKAGGDALLDTRIDLPLKSLDSKCLNKNIIGVHKKSLESRILSCIPNQLSSAMRSEKKNQCLNLLDNCKYPNNSECCGKKENQQMIRKNSISYKKRVSLAVKRYHLRRRKTIMLAKSTENGNGQNLELSEQEINLEVAKNVVGKQNTVLKSSKRKQGNKKTLAKKIALYPEKENIAEVVDNSSENQNATIKSQKLKGKQSYKNKEQEISVEVAKNTVGKQNTVLKSAKRKQGNKKTLAKKIDLYPEKGNIAELVNDSSENQIATFKSQKLKEKQNSKKKDLKQESEKQFTDYSYGKHTVTPIKTKSAKQSYKNERKETSTNKSAKTTEKFDTQNVLQCQRITRSMAKNHH